MRKHKTKKWARACVRALSWSRLAHAVAPAGRREEMREQSARVR
jgi:hypothetical protein